MSVAKNILFLTLPLLGIFGQSSKGFAQEASYFSLEDNASGSLDLNLNGPAIPTDTEQIALRVNTSDVQSFLSSRAQARIETIPNSNVYKKRSGFENLSLSVTIDYIHTQPSEEISLLDLTGAILSEINLTANGFVKNVDVHVGGDVTLEECLPTGDCAVLAVYRDHFRLASARYDAFSDFRDLIVSKDRGVVIKTRISDSTGSSFALDINDRSAIDALGLQTSLLTGQGEQTGQNFVGARGALGFYGYDNGASSGREAYKTVHVFPVGNSLRVQVVTEPFYACRYTYSGEFIQTYFQKRGTPCTSPDRAYFAGAAPGLDERTDRSYDFFGLSYP